MGPLVALLIWGITLVSVLWMRRGGALMPHSISDAARAVDSQLFLTFAVTGIVFVIAQGILGFFVWRYRERDGRRVRYIEGHNGFELSAATVVGVIFLTLGVLGNRVWAALHFATADPQALVVEVTGEQFAWNIRYPGPDGLFGRTDAAQIDPATNPLGIAAQDPAGKDDLVSVNEMAVPVGRAVEVRLGAKDVLHSFFVPALRIKQDTVPGLRIPLRFRATETGKFEVPCAELCGLGHYRMKGTLRVLAPEEFDAWLAALKAER